MDDKKSVWPFAMSYGAALGLINIILAVVFYLIVPFDPEKNPMGKGGWMQSLVSILIIAGFLYWSISKFRDESSEGLISYGRSFGLTMAMSIPASIITAIYVFIFFTYIDPEMLAKMGEIQANKMAEQGLSDEQIEHQMQLMNKLNNPYFYGMMAIVGGAIQQGIVGLVISIFTKREPKISE